jgi:serine/threonine-protein kinase ULK/ATG1
MPKKVGNYRLEEKIGSGSFATVYRATYNNSELVVAVKEISKKKVSNAQSWEHLAGEIRLMRTLNHPNIVHFIDHFHSERNVYVVMEYLSGGDLREFIQAEGRLDETTTRFFLLQLIDGLSFLNDRKIIHRDLKPQNILLTKKSRDALVKIADFGFVKQLEEMDVAGTICGTPLYMAPEIVNRLEYDSKVDMWSLGCIVYEMLVGQATFLGKNQSDVLLNVTQKQVSFPASIAVSEKLCGVLQKLLKRNPAERLGVVALQAECEVWRSEFPQLVHSILPPRIHSSTAQSIVGRPAPIDTAGSATGTASAGGEAGAVAAGGTVSSSGQLRPLELAVDERYKGGVSTVDSEAVRSESDKVFSPERSTAFGTGVASPPMASFSGPSLGNVTASSGTRASLIQETTAQSDYNGQKTIYNRAAQDEPLPSSRNRVRTASLDTATEMLRATHRTSDAGPAPSHNVSASMMSRQEARSKVSPNSQYEAAPAPVFSQGTRGPMQGQKGESFAAKLQPSAVQLSSQQPTHQQHQPQYTQPPPPAPSYSRSNSGCQRPNNDADGDDHSSWELVNAPGSLPGSVPQNHQMLQPQQQVAIGQIHQQSAPGMKRHPEPTSEVSNPPTNRMSGGSHAAPPGTSAPSRRPSWNLHRDDVVLLEWYKRISGLITGVTLVGDEFITNHVSKDRLSFLMATTDDDISRLRKEQTAELIQDEANLNRSVRQHHRRLSVSNKAQLHEYTSLINSYFVYCYALSLLKDCAIKLRGFRVGGSLNVSMGQQAGSSAGAQAQSAASTPVTSVLSSTIDRIDKHIAGSYEGLKARANHALRCARVISGVYFGESAVGSPVGLQMANVPAAEVLVFQEAQRLNGDAYLARSLGNYKQ